MVVKKKHYNSRLYEISDMRGSIPKRFVDRLEKSAFQEKYGKCDFCFGYGKIKGVKCGWCAGKGFKR